MSRRIVLVLALVAASWPAIAQAQTPVAGTGADAAALVPTSHPPLPSDLSQLWMVPEKKSARTAAQTALASAVKFEADANYTAALPMFTAPVEQQPVLGAYAQYYQGVAELRLGRAADARRRFQALLAREPVGYLREAAALREAECDEALSDQAEAVKVYERLSNVKTTAPDDVLMRLGRAAKAAGDSAKAAAAFTRVYYEFPFSDLSTVAGDELDGVEAAPLAAGSPRYALELGRAERLFGAKRYAQARTAFEGLKRVAQGDDRELVNLRLGECDYFLKRTRNARDAVRPYADKASRQGEALFFYAIAERDLGADDRYLTLVRRLVDEFGSQSWAEEALNNLASYYIVQDDDEDADATFREMYAKFPMGRYAERAAWKIGWWAYKNDRHAEAAQMFESAAARFPRSDYRPSWLYWSARAHDALKETALARARYALVATDYLNTYYGRLAMVHLDGVRPHLVAAVGDERGAPPAAAAMPPNEEIVRALIGLELYDQAFDELRYAQKMWGDSPPIQATIGWLQRERGDLRAGINAMKRAYPQYMAAGGEALPDELLKVLFPVNYWPMIRRYSAAHHLDPYLIAALIAQESTFTADIRSAANAYGLMQIVPATGRRYAKTLRLARRFSIRLLTTPEPNLRMGTAYFADLVKQFGGAHFALASYNAGENRVARWISERPGIGRDEFIDDIPFPETQNYVKKILGTAEDYRRLYGGSHAQGVDDDGADAADATPAVGDPGTAPVAKKASGRKTSAAKKSIAKPAHKPSKKAAAKKAPGKKRVKSSSARKKKVG